jgi:hypothetical protein
VSIRPALASIAVDIKQAASPTAYAIKITNSSSAKLFAIDVGGQIATGESLPGVPIVGVDPNSNTAGDLTTTSSALKPSGAGGATLTIAAGAAYTADATSSQTVIQRCYQASATFAAGSYNGTYYIIIVSSAAATTNGAVACTASLSTSLPAFSASKPVLVIGKAISNNTNWTTVTDTRFFIGGTLVYVNMPASSTYEPGMIVKTDTSADNQVVTTTSGADTPVAGIVAVGQTTGGAVGKIIMMTSGSAWAQSTSTATRASCAGTSTTAGAVNNVTAAVNACVGRVLTAAASSTPSVLVQVSPN